MVANLQPFERLQQLPVDRILTDFFSPDPNAIGPLDVGDFASAAATDWDGDGDMDLFVAHTAGLRIWENIGTVNSPDFSEVLSGFYGLTGFISSVDRPRIAGGDWNGDGLGDLVIGGNTGTVRLIASSGNWSSDGSGLDLSSGSDSAVPALGDMNGDGDDDLLLMLANGQVDLYLNDGSASPLAPPQRATTWVPRSPSKAASPRVTLTVTGAWMCSPPTPRGAFGNSCRIRMAASSCRAKSGVAVMTAMHRT